MEIVTLEPPEGSGRPTDFLIVEVPARARRQVGDLLRRMGYRGDALDEPSVERSIRKNAEGKELKRKKLERMRRNRH